MCGSKIKNKLSLDLPHTWCLQLREMRGGLGSSRLCFLPLLGEGQDGLVLMVRMDGGMGGAEGFKRTPPCGPSSIFCSTLPPFPITHLPTHPVFKFVNPSCLFGFICHSYEVVSALSWIHFGGGCACVPFGGSLKGPLRVCTAKPHAHTGCYR